MVESDATTDRGSCAPRDVVSTRRPPRRVDNTHPQGTVAQSISIYSFIIYLFLQVNAHKITIELTRDGCLLLLFVFAHISEFGLCMLSKRIWIKYIFFF